MRRAVLAALGSAGLVLAATPLAEAVDHAPSGPWRGSTLVPDPRPAACDGNDVCGSFRFTTALDLDIRFTVEAVRTTPGCTGPGPVTFGVGTPSRGFGPPLLSPPEDGFEDRLPFADEEPGGAEAVPPGAGPGRGLVIPFATGLVMAVWALNLRALSRLARPQFVDADDDQGEVLY